MIKYEKDMNQAFGEFCSDLVQKKMKQYESVCRSFAQFFNSEDLEYVLSKKADVTALN